MEAPIGTQEFSGDLPLVVNPFDKGKEVRLIDGGDRTNVLDWAWQHYLLVSVPGFHEPENVIVRVTVRSNNLTAIIDIACSGLFGTWEVNRNVLSVRQEKAMEYIIHLEKPDNLTQVV